MPVATRFTTAAVELDRAGASGLTRNDARQRCIAQAGSSSLLVQQAWRSPEGARLADALARWRTAAKAPDRPVTDAYRALRELAVVARWTGAAIDQADQHERNVLGAGFDRLGEARSRLSLNLGDLVGLVSDEDARRQREEMDRVNRVREQAASEREAALRAWSDALTRTALLVTEATSALRAATTPVPTPLIDPEKLIPPMLPRIEADDAHRPDDWNTEPKAPALPNHAGVQTMIAGAELKGMSNAARHMRHYLDNTGSPIEVDPDRMSREVPTFKASIEDHARRAGYEAARRAVAEGRLGQPVAFTTGWAEGTIPRPESEDWWFAVNGHHIATTGVVVVDAADPTDVTVTYRTHIVDRYNWDEGKVATIDAIGPFGPWTISDDEIGRLHKAGLAREYDMQGTSAAHTMTLGPGGVIADEPSAPETREHAGSRGDPGRVVPPDVPHSRR